MNSKMSSDIADDQDQAIYTKSPLPQESSKYF